MGRWAQAQRRGGAVNPPTPAPLAEFLEVDLPEENVYNITYTGDVPAGVNQIQTEVRLTSLGGVGDIENAAAPGPVVGNTCAVPTLSGLAAVEMRAQWLVSGTPVSAWSDWVSAGDMQCV